MSINFRDVLIELEVFDHLWFFFYCNANWALSIDFKSFCSLRGHIFFLVFICVKYKFEEPTIILYKK